MGKERVSAWGGREHFIAALGDGCLSAAAVWTFLVVWEGAEVGGGDEEPEGVPGDGGGESSRERLAMLRYWR